MEEQTPVQENIKAQQSQETNADEIDIHFEVCSNCESHAWCTHHDQKKYEGLFLEMKAAFESKIPGVKCYMNKLTPKPSTGAFEITHKNIIIYSKKFTGLFPSTIPTTERVKQFLDDLNNKRDTSKYARMQEKKYEPPRKPREKPSYQSFMKMEEEKKKKDQQQQKQESADQQQQSQDQGEQSQMQESQVAEAQSPKKEPEEKQEQTSPEKIEQQQNPEEQQQQLQKEQQQQQQQQQDQQQQQQEQQQQQQDHKQQQQQQDNIEVKEQKQNEEQKREEEQQQKQE